MPRTWSDAYDDLDIGPPAVSSHRGLGLQVYLPHLHVECLSLSVAGQEQAGAHFHLQDRVAGATPESFCLSH